MSRRKHRRADGTLRPTYRRYKQRKGRARRTAWLAEFEPDARDAFFKQVVLEDAVYLGPFERETGLPRDDAAKLLERIGAERRWRKLRTKDGTVVGIAPPRPPRVALVAPPGEALMACGHPERAVVSSGEGTSFCGECEAAS